MPIVLQIASIHQISAKMMAVEDVTDDRNQHHVNDKFKYEDKENIQINVSINKGTKRWSSRKLLGLKVKPGTETNNTQRGLTQGT